MHKTPYTTLLSTLFKSDLPPFGPSNLFNRSDPLPFDFKKIDKKPIDKILWHNICWHISIKNSWPE